MLLAANDLTTVWLWCGGTAVVLFALAGGFFAGLLSAPLLQDWAIRRAAGDLHQMFELVTEQLDRAQRMCAELATMPNCLLSAPEWQRLERLQRGFQSSFERISRACGMLPVQPAEREQPKVHDFHVAWVKTPIEIHSGLPNHLAYEANLSTMLEQGKTADLESGLLLVRMDKADGLRRRLGAEGVEKLIGRMSSMIVRAARDQDLLCRVNGDTLGLLCPALPMLSGTKVAEKIRDTIRNARFRVDENGPEVLVTASFGYAACQPGETTDIVRDRALDGLNRSAALGRNQLHVHDGLMRAYCQA